MILLYKSRKNIRRTEDIHTRDRQIGYYDLIMSYTDGTKLYRIQQCHPPNNVSKNM